MMYGDPSEAEGLPLHTCRSCRSPHVGALCPRCRLREAEMRLELALQDLHACQQGTPAQRLGGVALVFARSLRQIGGAIPAHRALVAALVGVLRGEIEPARIAAQVRAAAEWIEAPVIRNKEEAAAAAAVAGKGRAA